MAENLNQWLLKGTWFLLDFAKEGEDNKKMVQKCKFWSVVADHISNCGIKYQAFILRDALRILNTWTLVLCDKIYNSKCSLEAKSIESVRDVLLTFQTDRIYN